MTEWHNIPGIPDHQASWDGQIRNAAKGRVIKQRPAKNGARIVSIRVNGKQYTFMVHDLVARALFGRPPAGYRAKHRNGNLADNCGDNLAFAGAPADESAPAVLSLELEVEYERVRLEHHSLIELMQC